MFPDAERAPPPEMVEAPLEAERLPLPTDRVAPDEMDTCESLLKVSELMVVEELMFAEVDWALLAANTTAVAGLGAAADGDPEGEGDQLELSWPTQ